MSLLLTFFWKELSHMTILTAKDAGRRFLPVFKEVLWALSVMTIPSAKDAGKRFLPVYSKKE